MTAQSSNGYDAQSLKLPSGGPSQSFEVDPPSLDDLDERDLARVYHHFPIQPLPEDWTVDKIRSARKEHDLGRFSYTVRLRDVITTDPRVEAALTQRCATPLGLPVHVRPSAACGGKGVSATASSDVQAWFSRGSNVLPHGRRRRILEDLVTAGVALAQLMWKPGAKRWSIDRIEPWPLEYVFWNPALNAYQIVTTEGLLTPRHGDGKWLVIERFGSKSWMHGAVRSLSMPWADRTYGIRYRAQHAARHGSPAPVGSLPEGIPINSPEGLAFQKFIRGLWQGRPYGIIPKGATADLLELKTTAWQVFNDIVKCSDGDIAIALLGQDGTQAKGNVYTSPQFKGVRFDYVEDDARTLDWAFATGAAAPYVTVNYGEDFIPTIESAVPDPEEADRQAAVARGVEAYSRGIVALRSAGFRVTVDYAADMADRYGVVAPELDEDLEPLPMPAAPDPSKAATADETAALKEPPEETDAEKPDAGAGD